VKEKPLLEQNAIALSKFAEVKPKLEEVALNVLAFDQTPLSDVKPSISH
jgi:hypothetical protein